MPTILNKIKEGVSQRKYNNKAIRFTEYKLNKRLDRNGVIKSINKLINQLN